MTSRQFSCRYPKPEQKLLSKRVTHLSQRPGRLPGLPSRGRAPRVCVGVEVNERTEQVSQGNCIFLRQPQKNAMNWQSTVLVWFCQLSPYREIFQIISHPADSPPSYTWRRPMRARAEGSSCPHAAPTPSWHAEVSSTGAGARLHGLAGTGAARIQAAQVCAGNSVSASAPDSKMGRKKSCSGENIPTACTCHAPKGHPHAQHSSSGLTMRTDPHRGCQG